MMFLVSKHTQIVSVFWDVTLRRTVLPNFSKKRVVFSFNSSRIIKNNKSYNLGRLFSAISVTSYPKKKNNLSSQYAAYYLLYSCGRLRTSKIQHIIFGNDKIFESEMAVL